jgi:hypothetical protein
VSEPLDFDGDIGRLDHGSMPCDSPWPAEQLALSRHSLETGGE